MRRAPGTTAKLVEEHALVFAEMWNAQEGKCYLCGDPLSERSGPGGAHIDHDHSCCTGREYTGFRNCRYCRRGLACNHCNILIGHANDDPQRLRLIADNLEKARIAAHGRIASAGRMALFDDDA